MTTWPDYVKHVEIRSTLDGTTQKAAFFKPGEGRDCPLLIGLHPWSANYDYPVYGGPYAQWCNLNNWVFMYPDFRGPNNNPKSGGSDLVIQDILDARSWAIQNASVDTSRVYLIGESGGGYATLLMAGRAPQYWTAASAWVPVTDLVAWYFESKLRGNKYANDVIEICGGTPEPGSLYESECRKRSPLAYIANASCPVQIAAGINDGYTGSVPISHSLNAFNLLADSKDRLSPQQIEHLVSCRSCPTDIRQDFPKIGGRDQIFCRQSRNVNISIFDGGHEILHDVALNWLAQYRNAK